MAPPKRPWWRCYVEIVNDPKLRRRPAADRWVWITVLCIARASPIAGRLMVTERSAATVEDIADMAAVPVRQTRTALRYFESEAMIAHDSVNDAWFVTKFMERQYESDSSSDRSRKHRAWNADATAMQRPIDAPCNDGASVDATESSICVSEFSGSEGTSRKDEAWDRFDEFWATYPRTDDKPRARKAWKSAISRADADAIIAGAIRYRDDPNRDDGFTKMPATWLNADAWANGPLPPRGHSRRNGPVDGTTALYDEIEEMMR